MTDLNTTIDSNPTRFHWTAVWAGVFTFLAIWFVFGSLCLAIFSGSADLNIALSVWGIILTMIAMFVAGRTTGQLAGSTDSRDGIVLGMTMFGLAVTSACLICVIGSIGFRAHTIEAAQSFSVRTIFMNYGWALFVGLLLGWLAAIGGASSVHRKFSHGVGMREEVRHA
jgi:hypothetical protein